MQINTTKFQQFLSDEINKANIQKPKNNNLVYIILLIIFCATGFGLFIGGMFQLMNSEQFILLIIGVVLLVVGGAVLITWQKSKLNANKKYLLQMRSVLPSAEELYKKFYDLSVEDASYLKFEGFVKNSLLGNAGYGFKLDYHNQEFIWNTYEWTELRTYSVYDPHSKTYVTKTKTVYLMKDALLTYAPRLHDYELIQFANAHKKLFAKNKSYQTESMDFNKRFSVIGNNEFQIVKIFRPSVIDAYTFDAGYRLPGIINIDHGQITEKYFSGESDFSWNANIVTDITGFSIKKDVVASITNKIEHDFVKVLNYVDALEKLRIY